MGMHPHASERIPASGRERGIGRVPRARRIRDCGVQSVDGRPRPALRRSLHSAGGVARPSPGAGGRVSRHGLRGLGHRRSDGDKRSAFHPDPAAGRDASRVHGAHARVLRRNERRARGKRSGRGNGLLAGLPTFRLLLRQARRLRRACRCSRRTLRTLSARARARCAT